MIILEGMDNTGKSTLAKALSKEFGIAIDTTGRIKTLQKCVEFQMGCMVNSELIIYDRIRVISEGIYGAIIRGENIFGENWGLYLEMFLRTNPLVIYCRPPNKEIFNFGDREQMDGVIDERTALLAKYDKVMREVSKLTTNYVVYNWTDKRQKTANKINHYISQFHHRIGLGKDLEWKLSST